MYHYSPFVVTFSAYGEPRQVCIQLKATARDTFSDMGGRIIYGLVPHLLLMRFTIARYDMYFAFLFRLRHVDGCVHPSYVEVMCNCLNFE
jgi:hypothetical protein